ncbi:hypothetical protein E5082_30685 [Streptomyces griseoluteus]|uniref:Uncharacterized protein n=2 Tax=Streptomyces griseoluteus TaxID=29306 RepID=A0A4Z1CY98_STRGP|nr:hypothetical protein [Streptomyces griseoluteus]TGN74238.1 hypothetical protein E5082_30685 [Streptomyces griseoluteus]GHF33428.1 hypothetical protein GCM10017776_59910 [Streptomyces griseoluteus]
MGASSWQYIEPYAGDVAAALATVRQREFERLFVHGTHWDKLQPAGRPFTSVDDLDALWEDETFGSEGTHTIIDVWEVIDAEAYDDSHTVRPLSDDESREIFETSEPTRGDFERAQERYDARHPGSEGLWDMPRWSAWCRPLKDADGANPVIAFWGRSGD